MGSKLSLMETCSMDSSPRVSRTGRASTLGQTVRSMTESGVLAPNTVTGCGGAQQVTHTSGSGARAKLLGLEFIFGKIKTNTKVSGSII